MVLLRIEGILFLLLYILTYGDSETCTCDPKNTQIVPNKTCSYALDEKNNTVNMTGCSCLDNNNTLVVNTTTNTLYCAFVSTTTSAPTTRAAASNSTKCIDTNDNGICDYIEYAATLRCYNETMTTTMSNVSWYSLIFGSVWIIMWCVITIIINFLHKNNGHHRWIHLYEELGIIALIICVGILNFAFDHYSQTTICKIVAIASHFFMVLVAAAFFFEATFAESMVHGKPKKNGCLPAVLNYILPIIIAVIPTGLTFYFQQKNYGTTYMHCFAVLTQDMLWGFIIPVWIMICAATLQSQLACLACDMTTKEQDQAQCFWAKKSAKYLTLVAFFLLSIWLTIMHAGDEQLFYLFILAIILCIIFGPMVFIAHTSCHVNTCKKWGKPSGLKKIYMLCPERPIEKQIIYEEKIVYVDKPVEPEKKPFEPVTPAKATSPYNPGNPNNPYPADGSHTQAQQFYSWLYDKNKKNNSPSDILFKPKPY